MGSQNYSYLIIIIISFHVIIWFQPSTLFTDDTVFDSTLYPLSGKFSDNPHNALLL